MSSKILIHRRLHNHHLIGPLCKTPDQVVRWFGAVQAQDYLGSLWGIGMRSANANEAAVEEAIAERMIIRTWPMRNTLHFVPAEDVRWMLRLLTPHMVARSRTRYRQLELDDAVFTRSRGIFEKILRDGRQLTRGAIYKVLEEAGISTAQSRGLHILGRLAQDGLICFGPRQGKQSTFVLLDEWVPPAKEMDREATLAELARRYFTSHGPGTLYDFLWWSGLRAADARNALDAAKSYLVQERINGSINWLAPNGLHVKRSMVAHLLPPYDEYTVGYKDRSALVDASHLKLLDPVRSIFAPVILINGKIIGTWKRTFEKGFVVISPFLFARLNASEQNALGHTAEQYGRFVGLSVVMR